MKGLQIHLENLVSRAQCHMRRDELWKRMLYGRPKSEGKPSSVSRRYNTYSSPSAWLWSCLRVGKHTMCYGRVVLFPGLHLLVQPNHVTADRAWEQGYLIPSPSHRSFYLIAMEK